MNDGEGMRIIRGKGNRPLVLAQPDWLSQVAQGETVLVPIRVSAHLAGPGKGEYTDTLLRFYDLDRQTPLFGCGDFVVRLSRLVPVYRVVTE